MSRANEHAGYLPRLVDAQLNAHLEHVGAVLIEGPKACGKTATALQRAASAERLDVLNPSQLALARAEPRSVLQGERPRLIDEWQLVPDVWNQVRAAVDDAADPGQFILTGSATPSDDVTRHSGTGRFMRLRMHPMSLSESRDSDSAVSLDDVLGGFEVAPHNGDGKELDDIARILCRGGFPGYLRIRGDDALPYLKTHLSTIARADIVTVDGIRRDPLRVESLLFSLARNSASYVTKKTMALDMGDEYPASMKTLDSYLDALERLWIAVPQPAWGERVRSSARVRRAPKWHLADPSLVAAALNANPDTLLAEPGVFGQVFETAVFRDLSVYAQHIGASVYSYRDSYDREIDAVVERGGKWAAIECKLATIPEVIDEAAAKLLAVTNAMRKAPESLSILVPNGPSYRRPDGVNVIALASLGP